MKIRIGFIIKCTLLSAVMIGVLGFAFVGVSLYNDYNRSYEMALNETFLWKIHVNGKWYYSNVTPEVGPNIVTFIDGMDGKAKSFIGYVAVVESTNPIPIPQKKNLDSGA